MNHIRSIVSGNKNRFVEDGVDLDLIILTDRILIMGYPASGLESLYRNQRPEVVKFLKKYYGDCYRVFNLCPKSENAYVEDSFDGRVSRFPFPDHCPPPLSLIPLFVKQMEIWLKEDSRNVAVIHCKAGKGRSGTMAIAYLLAQNGFPRQPSSPKKFEDDMAEPLNQPILAGKALETHNKNVNDVFEDDDKLDKLLQFHTSRRMSRAYTGLGVSIPSQRRWLRYWKRILDSSDPLLNARGQRRLIRLLNLDVVGPGFSATAKTIFCGDKISAQLFSYKDNVVNLLGQYEVKGLNSLTSLGPWDDEKSMVVKVANFKEKSSFPSGCGKSSPSSPASIYSPSKDFQEGREDEKRLSAPLSVCKTLVPSQLPSYATATEGTRSAQPLVQEKGLMGKDILLDANKELQLKLLIGETGKKHGLLPAMAALGVIWFIPSFESSPSDALCKTTFTTADIDFLKPIAGISSVTIGWEWVPDVNPAS